MKKTNSSSTLWNQYETFSHNQKRQKTSRGAGSPSVKEMVSSRRKVQTTTMSQESVFRPSIKIFNSNKNAIKKDDQFRFYETPSKKHTEPPASKENIFINEQKYLLPHQRTKTPQKKLETISTDRVLAGARELSSNTIIQNSKLQSQNLYFSYCEKQNSTSLRSSSVQEYGIQKKSILKKII